MTGVAEVTVPGGRGNPKTCLVGVVFNLGDFLGDLGLCLSSSSSAMRDGATYENPSKVRLALTLIFESTGVSTGVSSVNLLSN